MIGPFPVEALIVAAVLLWGAWAFVTVRDVHRDLLSDIEDDPFSEVP